MVVTLQRPCLILIPAVLTWAQLCVPGVRGLPAVYNARRLQPLRGGGVIPILRRQVSTRHIGLEREATLEGEGKSHAPLMDAQLRALTITLVKTLLGSSILTLTGGLAGATDVKWAWIPGSVVTMAFALTAAYTYCIVGACCNELGATSYSDLWAKTISARSAWVPTTGCVAFAAIACQVYTIVMRDLLANLIKAFHMTLVPSSRHSNPTATTTHLLDTVMARKAQLAMLGSAMLPLCLLRSLTALAAVSWVGMAGVLYLTVFISWRCFSGAYLPGGAYADVAESGARFGQHFRAKNILVFFSLLHGCYQAHYDAPRFFAALAAQPRALDRFSLLAYVSFGTAGFVGVIILAAGYLTFGNKAKTVILNNYAPNDSLAALGCSAVLVSLMTSYPLVFNGFASNVVGLAALFARPSPHAGHLSAAQLEAADILDRTHRQRFKDGMAVMLVVANLCVAVSVEDLGFLCAFTGSVISGIIIFVFPPIFHMRVLSLRAAARGKAAAVQTQAHHTSTPPPAVWRERECWLWRSSAGICGAGLVLCALGAAVNLEIL